VQDLAQLAGKENGTVAFSQRTTALNEVLEDAQGGSRDFAKSLSKAQKSGLKEFSKKLEKADSVVAKHKEGARPAAWTGKERQRGDCKYGGQTGEGAGGVPGPAAQFRQGDGNSDTGDVKEKAG
jgi:hypothetical protein